MHNLVGCLTAVNNNNDLFQAHCQHAARLPDYNDSVYGCWLAVMPYEACGTRC
jgi:hypothetical protein